ncbi:hypothetical protein L7F22_010196 [Adiantum nelumboides]|nr:hypothetical protein [Adiantum nelumboides]
MISAIIHHTMVAARINFQQGAKRNLKPMEIKEKHEHKGKNQPQNSSKGNSSNNKAKEKGAYKEKNRLTSEELERYRKDNRFFKCGEQGHAYEAFPQRNARNEQPRASIIEAPKEDVHCKGSPLSYAWGKVREHDAFILFDPGSTHNFISHELAAKLSIQEFEIGDAMKADGAFIGQDASITPLIGKLRLHIQGYVDKEDFFISPLKHEDVILGAPWFDRLATSIKFSERRTSFKFREKNMYIDAQESGNTIPLVHTHAFDKSIKSSISVCMIFVKDSLSDVNKTQVNESGPQEGLELSKFLNQFQDVFIDDIPGELPPKRGDDDHAIELILGSSPPNKPPYRVSQAQQEEIMRQVNELVEKGMAFGLFFQPLLGWTYRKSAKGSPKKAAGVGKSKKKDSSGGVPILEPINEGPEDNEEEGLKVAFGKEGYVPEKGVFIVSICTYLGETTLVDEGIMNKWDPLWIEINKEFEEQISSNPILGILANHMFYVWEGNHRTVAWMDAIQERFFDRKEKHVCVLSTIIDPRKVSKISLLSCFQRMNFLNTHALVATPLRDELDNTFNICTSNSADYLKELTDEDVALIEQI